MYRKGIKSIRYIFWDELFVVVAAAGDGAIGGPSNVDDKVGEDVACGCGD
jgi:hypothetical protein